eukprot:14874-Heterococcus_DN1.PRE.9
MSTTSEHSSDKSSTKVLGLIGGIASGKSTVAKVLSEKCGAALIDADKLGHESYAPGQPCHDALVEKFGSSIVASDGSIDRCAIFTAYQQSGSVAASAVYCIGFAKVLDVVQKALGGLVFGNADNKKQLEAIVWPAIRTLAEQRLQSYREQGTNYVVLEAAIMLEAGWRDLVDELWVTSVPVPTAQSRLIQRNNLTEEQALARINTQSSRWQLTVVYA